MPADSAVMSSCSKSGHPMPNTQTAGAVRFSIPAVTHLERLRAAELDRIRDKLPAGSRVLELGGNYGYQAAILSVWGHQVASIDIAPAAQQTQFHPVTLYDGKTLTYDDGRFDVVFSSNVLEHVKDLGALLAESRRVLRRNGTAIHILPSPSWRFWTSIAHYAYVSLRTLGVHRPVSGGVVPSVAEKIERRGVWYVIRRALMAGPHGEYPSALSEMYYFSKRRWTKVFRDAGFEVVRVVKSGIFYTGYELLPGLSLDSRRKIAKVLGSATYIYFLRSK